MSNARLGIRLALLLLLLFYLRSYVVSSGTGSSPSAGNTFFTSFFLNISPPPPPSSSVSSIPNNASLQQQQPLSYVGRDGKRRLVPYSNWPNRDGEARPWSWPLIHPLSLDRRRDDNKSTTTSNLASLVVEQPPRRGSNLTLQQRRYHIPAEIVLPVHGDATRTPSLNLPLITAHIAVAAGHTPAAPWWWFGEPFVFGAMLWFDPYRIPTTPPPAGVVPFPVAIGRRFGTATMWTTEADECHGLLKPSWYQEGAVAGQLRPESEDAFKRCHTIGGSFPVGVIRGEAIAELLPVASSSTPQQRNKILLVSALGYDLEVVASFGKHLADFNAVSVSCQDFPSDSPRLYATHNASTCAEVLHCMRAIAPHHQLVNCDGGAMSDDECFAAGENGERRCLYRRHGAPWPAPWSHVLSAERRGRCAPLKVEYAPRNELKCPSIAFDFEIEAIG